MSAKRMVGYSSYDGRRHPAIRREGIGIFHCFSTSYEEFEEGPGNYPVAIIELYDGTVKVVGAELIKFLNNDSDIIKFKEEMKKEQ